jgi:Lon protease-like protein
MMIELPLFPLNTVLFPDMPIPLHIFEERYKLMVQKCIDEEQPFGIVLIREGDPEHGPLALPYEIGCTAEIANVQVLEDGRLLIMAIGQKRFRIVSLKRDQPYLVGVVEYLPLQNEEEQILNSSSNRLRPLVLEYLQLLSRLGDVEFDPLQVPANPEALGYLAAAVIQVPLDKKQTFLDANRVTHLLRELHHTYREEIALMRHMPKEDQGLFSVN